MVLLIVFVFGFCGFSDCCGCLFCLGFLFFVEVFQVSALDQKNYEGQRFLTISLVPKGEDGNQ